jgi:hypothetical protein
VAHSCLAACRGDVIMLQPRLDEKGGGRILVKPGRLYFAGADAVGTAEQKAADRPASRTTAIRGRPVAQRFVAVQSPTPSPQPGYSAKRTIPSAVVFDLKKPWIWTELPSGAPDP